MTVTYFLEGMRLLIYWLENYWYFLIYLGAWLLKQVIFDELDALILLRCMCFIDNDSGVVVNFYTLIYCGNVCA